MDTPMVVQTVEIYEFVQAENVELKKNRLRTESGHITPIFTK